MTAMAMSESEARREKIRMLIRRGRAHLERAKARDPEIRRLLEEARREIERERGRAV